MDGRHFAEEYIRRKKLADKGVVEKQLTAASAESKAGNSSGGWSEVAKKGGHKEQSGSSDAGMQGTGFKVVPGRKKQQKK
jgi:PERQ amino acid-rich with GYF domain-containing protein